jgi:hypothetical protein
MADIQGSLIFKENQWYFEYYKKCIGFRKNKCKILENKVFNHRKALIRQGFSMKFNIHIYLFQRF